MGNKIPKVYFDTWMYGSQTLPWHPPDEIELIYSPLLLSLGIWRRGAGSSSSSPGGSSEQEGHPRLK
jgi:hypothetical protein